jgi:Cu/Ag efflux pump CusA
MTESQKLTALRDMLIRRRRALVQGIQASVAVQLDGDDLARVQNEIEAVEKALAEEKRAEFRV